MCPSDWTLAAIGADLVRRGVLPRSGRPAWGPSTLRHIALTTPDDLDVEAA